MKKDVKSTISYQKSVGFRLRLRQAVCFILCICFALGTVPAAKAVTIPTEQSTVSQIMSTYSASLKRSGRRSFDGYCASYVNNQLVVLGVNKSLIGGNGKDEFDIYKNMKTTSGGYTVHAYSAASYDIRSALTVITSTCNVVTNVLVGFERTATRSGSVYGHVFLIHAIIDGYIYYSESFSVTVGGVTYAEGVPIKCTIDQLAAKYNTSFYQFEGIIWFEDEDLTIACIGGGDPTPTPPDPPDTPDDPTPEVPVPGRYQINASGGLRVRAGTSTSTDKIALLPDRSIVTVTEVSSNGWGRVFVDGKEGWISLAFAKRLENLVAVMEVYNSSGTQISRTAYSNLTEAVSKTTEDAFTYIITLNADCVLTGDTVIGNKTSVINEGYKLDTAGHMLDINGGKVTSTAKISALDSIPFVTCTKNGNEYVYTSTVNIEINSAYLSVNDNVSLCFKAKVSGVDTGKNTDAAIIVTTEDGKVSEYPSTSYSGGVYSFTTGGISAKRMADQISAKVRVRTTVNGMVYERTGTPIEYSPVQYVDSMYGSSASNAQLDSMLASMLNYGAAAQKYFDYNPQDSANCLLGDAVRNLSWDSGAVVRSEFAPAADSNSSVKVGSVQLVFLDTVALRFRISGSAKDSQLKLLVWTAGEYEALAAEAAKSGKNISELMVSGNCKKALSCSGGTFTLDGITSKQYADTYYVRLCETSGGKTLYDNVIAYSVTEYCYYKLHDGVNEDMDELCQAIAEYSAAARKYFGYKVNGG
ncbi:MAG: SH3 domain-containing protein [Clostridia bacterium]|nr:SH3 domain-containing protein [Clostridia bacterium]